MSTYYSGIDLHAKNIILMDLCNEDREKIDYACSMADENLHILYEEESETIGRLKEKYENNKE